MGNLQRAEERHNHSQFYFMFNYVSSLVYYTALSCRKIIIGKLVSNEMESMLQELFTDLFDA